MAQGSFIWDGNSGQGGLGDCGPYSAADWEHVLKAMMSGKSGISEVGHLEVTETSPTSKSVRVVTGRAVVRGKVYWLDADTTLTVPDNTSGNPRIDRVVLEADWATQTVRLKILEGTPAASPSPPTLTQVDGTLWQMSLAQVAVANGFTSISNSDITDEREFVDQPKGSSVVNVYNKSSNYQVYSSTFVAVDTPTFQRSITTGGGDLLVWFTGSFTGGNVPGYLDVWLDGSQVSPGGGGLVYFNASNDNPSFAYRITGVSAGDHTLDLYWKGGGSAPYYLTMSVDTASGLVAQFGVMEVE